MRRRIFALGLVLMGASAVLLAPAAGAQTGSLTFDPSSTAFAGGAKLFINVKCAPNTSGFIISRALAHQPSVSEFAGEPAIGPFTTSSTGTFGIGLTIDPAVAPGGYPVSLRCGGGLAASGTLTVVNNLPRTGAPSGKLVTVGAVLLAMGTALAVLSRHRARSTFS